MSSDSQLFIPDSFIALYAERHGRLRLPLAELQARYELCEDLANALVEQAQLLYFQSAPSESAILLSIHQGLSGADSGVSAPEARWVVLRLAELLDWKSPELPASGD
ncbi:hypothetical protein GCM10027082_13260 [Comamonas humi]